MIDYIKPTILRKDLEAVLDCMLTDEVGPGKLVKQFEMAISQVINSRKSIAVSNQSAALHLALLGLKIEKGNEIILPASAPIAQYNTIIHMGAKPVLADNEENSFHIGIKETKKLINKKTKAIIVSHKYGIPAGIEDFLNFEIPIIEDVSQAIGAEYKEKPVGSFGSLTICSLLPEMIITTGQGGVLCSNDKVLIEDIRTIMDGKNNPGYEYRISDFQAAFGLSQLKYLYKFIDKRGNIANFYDRKFRENNYKIYFMPEEKKRVYHSYPVFLKDSLKKVLKYMNNNHIDARPLEENPLYTYLEIESKQFPNLEYMIRKHLNLPIYPILKKKEAEKVVDTFLQFN